MNGAHAAPFTTRLALARRMIARGAARTPVDLADQLDAAGREAKQLHVHLGHILPAIEPERNWRHRTDLDPDDDARALLLAALIGCTTICIHLRRGGPQPAIARLPLRRVDCGRCVQTLYRSTAAEDECDLCGARGVETFVPFAVNRGPLLIAGDACGGCAAVLGIVQEAAG